MRSVTQRGTTRGLSPSAASDAIPRSVDMESMRLLLKDLGLPSNVGEEILVEGRDCQRAREAIVEAFNNKEKYK
ncbi:hypothetical protein J1N35_002788 [Gossypium stocksii]|uniref:Uncharacterized protein n=1 Tax=Gossypium stocksii TaxID=47602 RepID=A0A9D3WLT0_9ROSI|nr:hypothetical protein J1N35_002788 [Gossypium stocksii]